MKIYIGTIAATAIWACSCAAAAQNISLRKDESADLGSLYWISNCISTLKDFGGVEILEGPPGIELTIRQEAVYATRQNCAAPVPGGTVVLTAKDIPAKFEGTLRYRVRYNLQDGGTRQSNHSTVILLLP